MGTEKKYEDLPDEEVEVKIGTCRVCKKTISAAVWPCMDKKERASFMKECGESDFDVSTVKILDFRANSNWGCECKKGGRDGK